MATVSAARRSRNRISRGRGLRTRSGCLTCRKRHIKCDEAKPTCGPCARGDRYCDYEPSGHRSSVNSETVASNAAHQLSTQEQSPQTDPPADSTLHNCASNEKRNLGTSSWTRPSPDEIVHDETVHLPSAADQSSIAEDANHRPATLQSHHPSSPDASDVFPLETSESIESPGPTINAAAIRWFGLLADDAARESPQLSTALAGCGNDCLSFEHTVGGDPTQQTSLQRATQVLDYPSSSGAGQSAADASPWDVDGLIGTPLEKRLWQAQEPIDLLPREHFLFENFVQQVSQWIDLFDPKSQFATFVPHLAVYNAGLMNSILALSWRHLSLNPRLDNGEPQNREAALQYYYQTLHYVQKAMEYPTYQVSLELLATTLIISAYEMLDNSSNDWERHLEGVFLIQRSQIIHGESGGLQAAVWWAWLCQDIWAAFRERRKTLTFWIPQMPLASLSPHELAARSVYVTAKVINFCSQQESTATAEGSIQIRIDKANRLHAILDEWRKHLTIEFSPLPVASQGRSTFFRPIWICPPAFGVAMQLHYAARILLLSHEPSLGGLSKYLERQAVIQQCVKRICGIATTLKDDASSLMSSQALFIAGMFAQGTDAREAVLELLDSCKQRSGWPVKPLGDELRELWWARESPKPP